MNLEQALAKLPETPFNVVSVLSGGLDSTILTYILVKKYGKDKVFAFHMIMDRSRYVSWQWLQQRAVI